ncbi:MAG: hypothetical protein WCK49_06040 [Myxococcaceae bacterium]
MKLFFLAALNLLVILCFFLFVQQKNRNLIRQFEKIESSIQSKQALQLAIQDFKAQQQQVLIENKNIENLEPLKVRTLDFVLGLVNELPVGISLVELTKSESTYHLKGIADSKEALRTFVNLHHLKLIKSKGLSFEVLGTL